MTLGQDEPVAVLFPGVLGIDPHLPKVEIGEHISGREAAAGMTSFCAMGTGQDALPDADSGQLQGAFFFWCHGVPPYWGILGFFLSITYNLEQFSTTTVSSDGSA